MTRHLNKTTSLGCLGLMFALGACSGDEISATKAAARDNGGFDESGNDLCASNQWYGDDECDFFCPEYDEDDCGVACAAVLPDCPDGKRLASPQECEQLEGCEKITSCGGTAYCADLEPECSLPACMYEGENIGPVDPSECDAPDSCTRHETCGNVYYCKSEPKCDVAVQPCPPDTRGGTAEECNLRNDCTIYSIEECGIKTYCVPEEPELECDPVCNPGDETANVCPPNATCYEAACLDNKILCQKKEAKGCFVGGCSSQLCTDDASGPVSTCEWLEQYACYHDATCERQADGECGWTQTDDLTMCLKEKS